MDTAQVTVVKPVLIGGGGSNVKTLLVVLCVFFFNFILKLGLRCSTNGPEHPHVGACCGRWRERSMTYVAVHAINFTSH